MASFDKKLILASASPRRREILERFGVPFTVRAAGGPEAAPPDLPPGELVKALAAHKAEEVARLPEAAGCVVLAADTVVELDGAILGKPRNEAHAAEMLRALSGREHRVWSGICVREGERAECESESAAVRFRPLSDSEIAAYIATGEPMDKAGAYGYQSRAGLFVESIRGDFFNVMGLPLCRTGLMLRRFGIELL